MQYWWVNQKQTYHHEIPGGYLWSPKRNKNGAVNRSYDAMKKISPGDVVYSFANAHIKAIGIAGSYCYEFPKPTEFGVVGDYWGNIGWRVDVRYQEIPKPIKPKNHIDVIRPMLPVKYSPLQANGNGNQNYYLYSLSGELALALARLMDRWVIDLLRGHRISEQGAHDKAMANISMWEDDVEKYIRADPLTTSTEKEALVKARRGQGKFRERLLSVENACRVTKVTEEAHLVASHTKPWRDCSNEERLDPENGFMLTPTIDHLFDRGFISFEDGGRLIISDVAHRDSIIKMRIPTDQGFNVGVFSEGQKRYLDWHRESILLG